ncbi:hypothetical protein HPB49_019744 [Dermacentor silvarum]|uniref:Uncharacterized protein n=1 Tax=Dermacentor silvarum TaxID=543639 RepID=A0ACB8DFH0_DERSI|nr:hypothetical protein HPB49_019744 [Dermacentor silvarum]
MDKTPYVLLERINADSQRAFEHGLQRIPIAKRRPIVLVEKLPVAVTYGLRQSGDNPSGQPARKIPKRKLSPGPSRRPCPDTPSKRVCFSDKGSRKYPHMRLWTGPKSNATQKTGSAKENGTSQYYSHKSLWEDEAQSSVQSAISSVKSANLAVLLGVRSRGVPIVELERLQTVTVYKHCDMPFQDTVTADSQPPGNKELSSEDSDTECDLPEFSKASRKRKTSHSPRKMAAVGYQETESSDDNWIYDQNEHLVALDGPKRLNSVNLFLSAQISPVWGEEREGIQCKDIGPIRCWWLTGYSSGEKPVIGISTDSADYYISNEHEAYADFMKPLRRKMHLTKLVVNAVNGDPNCSYENLVKVIQVSVPNNVSKDTPLRRFSQPTDTLATCTPLVQDVFHEAFASQMSEGASACKKTIAWCGSPEDTGTVLVYSAVMIGDEKVKRKFFYREWYEEGGKPYTASMSASCPKDGFTYSKM